MSLVKHIFFCVRCYKYIRIICKKNEFVDFGGTDYIIYVYNKSCGPKTDPYGTPYWTDFKSDDSLNILVNCDLSER